MDEKNSEIFVPGRVCLFGEHSDWAGGHRRQNSNLEKGYAIVAPTNQGNYARIKAIPEKILRFILPDGKKFEISLENEEELLRQAEQGDFFSYICGVAHEIVVNYNSVKNHGIEIDNYKTTLPIKKGLSSSASICVLVARAFNLIYGLNWTRNREMEIAYLGETTTPSRCGRLDQSCAYNVPVVISFDADKINIKELKITKPLFIVLVNLNASKDTKKILACLNKGFPFPSTESEVKKAEYLGGINKFIVLRAKQFTEQGDLKSLGELMNESQRKFDEYLSPFCHDELSAPKLHKLLSLEEIQPLIYGGKCVGSGGDGMAQLLAKDNESQIQLVDFLNSNKDLDVEAISFVINP